MSRKQTSARSAGKAVAARGASKARPPARAKGSAKASPAPAPKPAARPVASAALKGVAGTGTVVRGPESEGLRIGDDLPALGLGPLSRIDIARFCAATGTWNPLSLDEPAAKASGLPSVVVPGGLAFGLAGECIGRWLRSGGRVRRIGARCVKMIWPGDQLTARARVSDLRAPARELDLDVWVENQKGELVLKGQATCEVTAAIIAAPPPAPVREPIAAPKAAPLPASAKPAPAPAKPAPAAVRPSAPVRPVPAPGRPPAAKAPPARPVAAAPARTPPATTQTRAAPPRPGAARSAPVSRRR